MVGSSLDPQRTHTPADDRRLGRSIVVLLVIAALLRLVLAAEVTGFVLVDDAYIHLRYARNLVEHGALVYNRGEAVFGVTSPAYTLLCAGSLAAFGTAAPAALIVLGIVAWTAASWVALRNVARGARLVVAAVLSLAPGFVDNQLLGMESACFVLLAVLALEGAHAGRSLGAAVALGLALVTRPEAVLLAPWCVAAAWSRPTPHGAAVAARTAWLRPTVLAAVCLPGLAWAAFALSRYGTVVPQSLVAKSGWNNAHYEGLFASFTGVLALPRLTYLPFVDHLPRLAQVVATGSLAALVGALGVQYMRGLRRGRGVTGSGANDTRGSVNGRQRSSAVHWFGFYVSYVALYLAGKGATEASWYAVPSSFALTLRARAGAGRSAADEATGSGRGWHGARVGARRRGRVRRRAARPAARALLAWVRSLRRGPRRRSAPQPHAEHRVVIGEIGVFGFASPHVLTDVGALVSPEVLPWKNAGASFVEVVQRSGASAFVISRRALETNEYPTLAATWRGEDERRWLESCEFVAQHLDKCAYLVPPALRSTP
jgi:hypothetical protein